MLSSYKIWEKILKTVKISLTFMGQKFKFCWHIDALVTPIQSNNKNKNKNIGYSNSYNDTFVN